MGAPRKRRLDNLQRDLHEEKIRQYLYDEGPSTLEDLQDLLGLSRARTSVLLTNMRASGLVEQAYLRDKVSYWLLAEDMTDV